MVFCVLVFLMPGCLSSLSLVSLGLGMMQKQNTVQRVLLLTLVLNLTVAFGKILLGLVTGALAITADGFHSITDSAGNLAGLVALRVAAKPADQNHPYGHHRFESLAALLIGALLLLTAWEI